MYDSGDKKIGSVLKKHVPNSDRPTSFGLDGTAMLNWLRPVVDDARGARRFWRAGARDRSRLAIH